MTPKEAALSRWQSTVPALHFDAELTVGDFERLYAVWADGWDDCLASLRAEGARVYSQGEGNSSAAPPGIAGIAGSDLVALLDMATRWCSAQARGLLGPWPDLTGDLTRAGASIERVRAAMVAQAIVDDVRAREPVAVGLDESAVLREVPATPWSIAPMGKPLPERARWRWGTSLVEPNMDLAQVLNANQSIGWEVWSVLPTGHPDTYLCVFRRST